MKGLELSQKFYETYGAPMLHAQFAPFEEIIAVALCGSGSECFGFDDEISRDHDFEPGFCLFLPGEDVIDRRTAFLLERAYAKLPKEFLGFSRAPLSPVGGNRHGVLRMDEFFAGKVGAADGKLTLAQWMQVPEFYLAEATNGKVFRDDCGAFTAVRERLSQMPEDVRLKKLAGSLLLMAQSGQYNYERCLLHKEPGAAALARGEFVRAALHAIFLLNRAYLPFYKWQFRALRELPQLSELAPVLLRLLTETDSDAALADIEAIAQAIIAALQAQNLTAQTCGDLEKHAYAVNDRIGDPQVRNLHILSAV
ncbi:MAG: DUF4037 domain-containing protein [Clostridia bacterium]|nr:DUF4037 domain-containing protein [Clostridia bacterium]